MMAETDLIGEAATRRNFDQIGEVAETVRVSFEALVMADDERSELLFDTAPVEGAMAGSSKCRADKYVSARRRLLEQMRSECGSEAEFEIAKSREHWTVVGRQSTPLQLVQVANLEYFRRLLKEDRTLPYSDSYKNVLDSRQSSYFTPSFFVEYGDDELVVGEKIGEGGQAEIFKAAIRGKDEYVLKVFKPDFSLADLERHWTIRARNGLYHMENQFLNCCFIKCGTLLKNGSFAFVMDRYWGDLRRLIDQKMKDNNGRGPPFPPHQALEIMFWIAKGMKYLHSEGILHRDLKASNVLLRLEEGVPHYYRIADFESSRGVHGTGFWRAPEVLQALKNRVKDPDTWKNIWSEKVDVYSYAMTSYEVLTGRIPFGDLEVYQYDVVLRGERPLLPDYVDHKIHELLTRCWHSDPSHRPTFCEVWDMVKGIYSKPNQTPDEEVQPDGTRALPTLRLRPRTPATPRHGSRIPPTPRALKALEQTLDDLKGSFPWAYTRRHGFEESERYTILANLD